MDKPEIGLKPREIGLILLITLAVYISFMLFSSFLDETLALLLGEIIVIVPALVYIFVRRLSVFKIFRFRRFNFSQLVATIFLFIPLYILTDELDRIVQAVFPMPPDWHETMFEQVQFHSVQGAAIILLAGVVFAALCEEMFFRGLLQGALESFQKPVIAIVLSSIVFAFFHFNPWMFFQLFILGTVLGYTAWKSGTILPAIWLHALNNLMSLIMINSEDFGDWYIKSDHVNLVWLAGAVVLILPAIALFNRTHNKIK